MSRSQGLSWDKGKEVTWNTKAVIGDEKMPRKKKNMGAIPGEHSVLCDKRHFPFALSFYNSLKLEQKPEEKSW